ncbi:polyphosphate kinase 2 family protein [Micrococcus luteus]|uniref:hypothetical protein n=1 Tax=Micrococcus luteus TaxID=1270 RepID=UPI0038BACB90
MDRRASTARVQAPTRRSGPRLPVAHPTTCRGPARLRVRPSHYEDVLVHRVRGSPAGRGGGALRGHPRVEAGRARRGTRIVKVMLRISPEEQASACWPPGRPTKHWKFSESDSTTARTGNTGRVPDRIERTDPRTRRGSSCRRTQVVRAAGGAAADHRRPCRGWGWTGRRPTSTSRPPPSPAGG